MTAIVLHVEGRGDGCVVVDVGLHTVAHIGGLIELHGQHTHSLRKGREGGGREGGGRDETQKEPGSTVYHML